MISLLIKSFFKMFKIFLFKFINIYLKIVIDKNNIDLKKIIYD